MLGVSSMRRPCCVGTVCCIESLPNMLPSRGWHGVLGGVFRVGGMVCWVGLDCVFGVVG